MENTENLMQSIEVPETPRRSVFDTIALVGFMAIIVSTFMNFLPIFEKSWRAGAVGFPVMLFCIVAIFFTIKKQYFASFFIGMFAAFFLIHEIIVIYDNRAVQLGQELGANGYFRLVMHIFADAFQKQYGAFWGFWGSVLAVSGVSFAWMNSVIQENRAAAIAAESASDEDEDYEDEESSDDLVSELDERFFDDIEDSGFPEEKA